MTILKFKPTLILLLLYSIISPSFLQHKTHLISISPCGFNHANYLQFPEVATISYLYPFVHITFHVGMYLCYSGFQGFLSTLKHAGEQDPAKVFLLLWNLSVVVPNRTSFSVQFNCINTGVPPYLQLCLPKFQLPKVNHSPKLLNGKISKINNLGVLSYTLSWVAWCNLKPSALSCPRCESPFCSMCLQCICYLPVNLLVATYLGYQTNCSSIHCLCSSNLYITE